MMTEDEKRIAIAVACGWRITENPYGLMWNDKIKKASLLPGGEASKERLRTHGTDGVTIPDYLNDLNAMHEAEKMLRLNQFHYVAYWRKLFKVVTGKDWEGNIGSFGFELAHATASERADAFLKVISH